MAADAETFLHLSRPLAPTALSLQGNISPLSVNIQPQAILSILDHAIRRDAPPTSSPTDTSTDPTSPSSPSSRVIGALIGTRSEDGSEMSVTTSFAIPHTENDDQVEVDVEYQKNMLLLHLKASPRDTLLGWYTTSLELNSFSALIQNFFASPDTGTYPHPALHLTVCTEPGLPVAAKAYISAPVGISPDRAAESCFFVQVPHRIVPGATDAERSALELMGSLQDTATRESALPSDIEGLARSLEATVGLLDRVAGFVGEVIEEERDPNQALGQYLMSALSLAPKVDPATIEHDFNDHVQDVLMVSYLANSVRTQIELSHRLATALLSDEKVDKEDGGKERGERGERGGKRGGRGGRGGGRGGRDRGDRENREGAD